MDLPIENNEEGHTTAVAERGAHRLRCGHTELRDVKLAHIATALRTTLGLPPDQPVPGEEAATFDQPVTSEIGDLDAGAWIAWCLVGLSIFTGRSSLFSHPRAGSTRVTVALAMLRSGGNVSAAARALGISRKALRGHLRAAGLYPWRRESGRDDRDRGGA